MIRERAEIGIRDATEADLIDIAARLNAQIAESPYIYSEVQVTIEDRRAWLSSHQAAGLPVIVAEQLETPRVIGWAALSPYRASSGYRFSAEASVYVAPAAHRRGIGARLLAELLERATERGLHAVIASIDAENLGSVALFEQFGFVERARLPEVGRKFGEWRTQLLLARIMSSAEQLGDVQHATASREVGG